MARHIMIDIETLSSASNAAIVSIGAVSFNISETYVELAKEEDSFIVGINPDWYDAVSPIQFDTNDDTIRWWSKQSKAAQDSLKINKVQTLPLALDLFYEWVEKSGFNVDDTSYAKDRQRVWAMPASFDLPILRNGAKFAYGDVNQVPWHYRQEMCARAHRALFNDFASEARAANLDQGLVAHRADHDAIKQARVLQFIEKRRSREWDLSREQIE